MILGRFYFTQSDTGNLLGEFSHNSIQAIITESADVREFPHPTEQFVGIYSSTWFEEGIQSLTLDIRPKRADDRRILLLRWFDATGDIFFGEGFVANGILIGTYWDEEMNRNIPT